MKNVEIQNLSLEDLKNQLAVLKADYNKMKLAHRISPIENPIQIRDLRKTIARFNTAIAAKQQ